MRSKLSIYEVGAGGPRMVGEAGGGQGVPLYGVERGGPGPCKTTPEQTLPEQT